MSLNLCRIGVPENGDGVLRHPFLQAEGMDINWLPEHVFTELLHERVEECLFHGRDRRIVVTALAEQRAGALLHGVGPVSGSHNDPQVRLVYGRKKSW